MISATTRVLGVMGDPVTHSAVPAIVALRPEAKFAGRVPVVPVEQLGQFADQLPGRLDEVLCVSPDQDGG